MTALRALRYAFDEAFVSLWRGRQAGLVSIATIALALFVLGGVLVATSNLQRLGDELGSAAELSVYLHEDVTGADRAAVERLLAPGGVVAGFEFVSKVDALTRFKETFTDLAAAVDTVDGNPFPASYEVRLQPAGGAAPGVDELAERLRAVSGVAEVRYDRAWLDRLLSAVSGVRVIGLLLSGILTLAAAFTVANVVRLALYERRDELEIMELVGAPQAYVRGPFVMEGVLQGGLGAFVALAALGLGFLAVRGRFLMPVAEALNLSTVRFLSPTLCALLVGGGMLLGCLGGLVASRRR